MRVKRKLFKVHSFGKVQVRTSRRIFFFIVIKLLQWIFFKQSPQCGNWSLKSFFVLTKPDHPFLHFFSVYFIFSSFHLTQMQGICLQFFPKQFTPLFSLSTCLSFRFCYLCRKKCSVTQFVPFAPQLTDAWFTELPCGFKTFWFTYFYLGASITQLARMAATN